MEAMEVETESSDESAKEGRSEDKKKQPVHNTLLAVSKHAATTRPSTALTPRSRELSGTASRLVSWQEVLGQHLETQWALA